MKKIIPAVASTLIFTTTSLHTNAEKANAITRWSEFKNEIVYDSFDKTLPETIADNSILYKISFKAVSHFMTTYPEATDAQWEIVKDGYIANFASNSSSTKIYYNKKGTWLHSINQYDESKLPKSVRARVKSTYYDYTINLVKEVNVDRKDPLPIYLVYIQDGETYKTIRVCDGEMEEIPL